MRSFALAVLLLFLIASTALSQVPDDKLIVPGQRIGKWTLDMTIDDLFRINGTGICTSPITSPAYVSPFIVCLWLSNPLNALTRDRKKVEVLAVTTAGMEAVARVFKTEKGIGTGSMSADVLAAYGNPTGTVQDNWSITMRPELLLVSRSSVWMSCMSFVLEQRPTSGGFQRQRRLRRQPQLRPQVRNRPPALPENRMAFV